jgi:ribose 5-phosphate isomerase A
MAENPINFSVQEKMLAAKTAVSLVKEGDIVGLGTGSTANFVIEELARKVDQGFLCTGVCSSLRTEKLASEAGISILPLGTVAHIDISIDGADEFDEHLNLIKGGGGALFREKIVASLSSNRIIVVDSSKKVEKLGAFKVPVEIIPEALTYVIQQLENLDGSVRLRKNGESTFITDNRNYIVDADFGLIENVYELSAQLNQIDGLLAHGLFVNLTSKIIMAKREELYFFDVK